MARTNIPLSPLVANAEFADPAGTPVDAVNGHVIAVSGDWPAPNTEEIVLRVVNGVTAMDVTVLAGTNPPALEAGLGDLVASVGSGATAWLGPFSSSRFLSQATVDDAAGLWVDVSDGTDGDITAFRVPRTA
jgi:hypothetical protein